MTDAPGGDDDYRRRAKANLDRAIEILAHISFGDYGVDIDIGAEDEEFVELFVGLSMLQDDLREARTALEEARRGLERQVRERTAELHQANRELSASESMYRSLVQTSPDPIVLTDADAQVLMVNQAFVHVFRIDGAEAVLGRSLFDLVAPADRGRSEECWRTPRANGAMPTDELRFLRGDESELLGQVRSTIVCDQAGVEHGVLCIIQDVTEQRRREDEVLRAEKLESLGTLAGGIAHDFNNTLAVITTSLFLAAERTRDDPEVRELLLGATDAAFRATALTKQLLTFSKGGAPIKKCVDCAALVRHTVDFCLHGSSVGWSLEVSPDLWPVEVDEGQLGQALANLVINARQAMPEGGNIEVRAEKVVASDPEDATARERRYVRVSVRDEGVGIPAKYLKRIYDPYFTTKEAGSGLGLATAFSVVRKHGGFLTCGSTPGEGSTFSVYLPASDREPEPAEPLAAPPASGQGRVLVMDDDPRVLESTQKLLRYCGYDVVGVTSGAEALREFADAKRGRRDFVATITDLTVPGGDGGKEIVGKLLELDPDARVIVSSGYSDDPVLAHYREYGFSGVLSKPFRLEEILRVLQSASGG